MNAPRTARARARSALTEEIKIEARRQLAEYGAGGLSLRAIARELGMVSSALYRYFASRDELLTALIADAYDAMGAAVETAAAAVDDTDPRQRWLAACHAARKWARARPHEYALIYGSPVPGYRAPQATIAPAARVPLVLLRAVGDGLHDGSIQRRGRVSTHTPPTGDLADQLDAVAATVAPGVDADTLVRAIIAWTQLFGMISFELFGQLVGSLDPADDFFECAASEMADFVGFVPTVQPAAG